MEKGAVHVSAAKDALAAIQEKDCFDCVKACFQEMALLAKVKKELQSVSAAGAEEMSGEVTNRQGEVKDKGVPKIQINTGGTFFYFDLEQGTYLPSHDIFTIYGLTHSVAICEVHIALKALDMVL
ncbi:hypothetical protein Moror_2965 [Moniliophthora roreri MCA 2997]|uniref:Uncharacterized protein n=1 Tax=Moniliophthora roreri (strain MCA 2997) TaxID=1381753 RepID=V2WJN5_MONRO|nr:hypothetical protein Moror_2965 [Moniliophthora roreri MCA 2997]